MAFDGCESQKQTKGSFITSSTDYSVRAQATLSASVYTVSVFGGDNPGLLYESIDLVHVSHIGNLFGAPECLQIVSDLENKTIRFCFAGVKVKKTW